MSGTSTALPAVLAAGKAMSSGPQASVFLAPSGMGVFLGVKVNDGCKKTWMLTNLSCTKVGWGFVVVKLEL